MDKRFGVLLGADSLVGRRSGVGRYTIEIARVLRKSSNLVAFGLAVEGSVCDSSFLDFLPDFAENSASPPMCARRPEPPLIRKLRDTTLARSLYDLKERYRSLANLRTIAARADSRLLYHEPNMIPASFDYPTVTTIHDLSWWHHKDMHPKARIDWVEKNLGQTLDRTTRFVAVSHFTAAEFMHAFGVKRDRIDVIPNAPSDTFRPMSKDQSAAVLQHYALEDRGYILSVSTIEPRKNLDRLLRAHSKLPAALKERFPLVIAGGSGWGHTLDCPAAEQARRSGTLRMLGHVSDHDLAVLYARCATFAYVSLYEGFGLPVIEAMAADAPVVTSAATGTAETAANAAILVDPTDEEAITTGIRSLLEDLNLAQSYRMRGKERAAKFSWERTVAALLGTWRTALGDDSGSAFQAGPRFYPQLEAVNSV